MASTFSALKIELIGNGEQSGTWGVTTNTNLGTAIEEAITGRATADFPTDADLTLGYTDSNAAQTFRNLILNVTSTGSLTATRNLIVPTIEKQYLIENNTSGGQSIVVKTSAGTGVTVPNGRKMHLYANGTDVVVAFDYVTLSGGTATLSSLTVTGNPVFSSTGAATMPVGTVAQRPSPAKGMFRFNDDSDEFEGYDGSAWGSIGGGSDSLQGFRNRLINSDMRIDQRNAGASFSPTTTSGYTLDRWVVRLTQNSKLTVQQNAGAITPPPGFTNYLGVTSSSAYAVPSTDVFTLAQAIEGFNTADLGFGTANAATVTLSFWVRSSLTGSFGGALINSAGNRSYPFSYTISAANTWEQKTVTIAGDTSGTWLTNSSTGIEVRFGLGAGSNFTGTADVWGTANAAQPPNTVSVVGTNGATFYITGVQLEVGSVASPFERRPYGTELMLCQRYFEMWQGAGYTSVGFGGAATTNGVDAGFVFKVTKRVAPTLTYSAVGDFIITSGNFGVPQTCTTLNILTATFDSTYLQGRCAGTPFTVGNNGVISSNNTSNAKLFFNSEL